MTLPFLRQRDEGPKTRTRVAPASIMVPRVLFLVTALGILAFGLLMIYSSSSIVGLTSKLYGNDPAYFVVRQLGFAVAGAVLAFVFARIDYHMWQGKLLKSAWVITIVLLVVVYTPLAGRDAYGATRWIAIGPFSLQPSEFAKFTVVLVGAYLAENCFWRGTLSKQEAAKLALVGICIPLALVLWQPDKGTTGVMLLTLLVMSYLAGVRGQVIIGVGLVAGIVAFAWSLKDDYSRARIITMFDPSNDPYNAGYQLMQGFYAFGSGGITGLGLGMSRQKYNYLPMAHNDFIFAVVGEELGLVGALGMLAAFVLLLWSGFKIAEAAPDMVGRLIAAGCTSLFIIQLLLNVGGVLGMMPLTGKPVPFVSYGGSSIISCLMLVGLVMSVSLRSTLPETSYEVRRSRLRLAPRVPEGHGSPDAIGTGPALPLPRREESPMPVMSSPLAASNASRLRLVEGGRSPRTVDAHADTSRSYRRLELGPSPAERLRGTSNGAKRARLNGRDTRMRKDTYDG